MCKTFINCATQHRVTKDNSFNGLFGVTYKMYRNSQFISLILYRYLKPNILKQYSFIDFTKTAVYFWLFSIQWRRCWCSNIVAVESQIIRNAEVRVIRDSLHHRVLFIDLICFLLLLVLFAKFCGENTFHAPIVIHIFFIILRFYY